MTEIDHPATESVGAPATADAPAPTTEQAPATPVLSEKELADAMRAARDQRVQRCAERIRAVLEEERCDIVAEIEQRKTPGGGIEVRASPPRVVAM